MAPALDLERRRYGKEVVYTVVRAKHVYDSRWDSHFGEMMLDDTTVPRLQGGDIRFNNGKQVLLGFHSPHQGYFKVLIPKAHWAQFGGAPDKRYRIGQRVRVNGAIAWYQGDPAVYARAPEQIEVG